MPNVEKLQSLYDVTSEYFDLGDFDSFSSKMQDIEGRRNFYNQVRDNGFNLGDYMEYEQKLAPERFEKKKEEPKVDEPTELPLEDTGVVSEETPEPGVSAAEKEESSFWSDIGSSFNAGVNTMFNSFLRGTNLASEVVKTPSQRVMELNSRSETMNADDLNNAYFRGAKETIDEIPHALQQDVDNMMAQINDYEYGIGQSFAKGNFADGGRQLANAIAQTTPNLLTLAFAPSVGGPVFTGTLSGLGKLTQMEIEEKELGVEYDVNQKLGASLVFGASDGVADVVLGGIVKGSKNVLQAAYNKGGREAVEQTLKGFITETLVASGQSASTEAVVQLSQNAADIYFLDKDVDIFDNVVDASIIGWTLPGAMRTPAYITGRMAGMVGDDAQKNKAKQDIEAINESVKAMVDPNVSEQTKKVIQDTVESKIDENADVVEGLAEQFKALPTEQRRELIDIQNEMDGVEDAMSHIDANTEMSPESKQSFKEELSEQWQSLKDRKDAIIEPQKTDKDAQEVRTQAEDTGTEDGTQRGETERVRVRDDEKARLETEAGETQTQLDQLGTDIEAATKKLETTKNKAERAQSRNKQKLLDQSRRQQKQLDKLLNQQKQLQDQLETQQQAIQEVITEPTPVEPTVVAPPVEPAPVAPPVKQAEPKPTKVTRQKVPEKKAPTKKAPKKVVQGEGVSNETIYKTPVQTFNENVSGMVRSLNAKVAKEGLLKGKKFDVEMAKFIKKNVPSQLLTKGEFGQVITAMKNAKTLGQFSKGLAAVQEQINKATARVLQNRVNDLLKGPYTVTKSGQRTGKQISPAAQARIKNINQRMSEPANFLKEINDIEKKAQQENRSLTQEELRQIDDLVTLENLQAANLSATAWDKMTNLDRAQKLLEATVKDGKSELSKIKQAKHQIYNNATRIARRDTDVMGWGEQSEKGRTTRINNRKFSVTKDVLGSFTKYINTHEDLGGLVNIISKGYGDLVGGKLGKLITTKFARAESRKKRSVLNNQTVLRTAKKSIFGKRWKLETLKNGIRKKTGIVIDGQEISLSQNEMYYLYNHYKNPATHKGFESAGLTPGVMSEITNLLDPQVKQWADYLTDEYFPNYYKGVNDVYREMYYTDMPTVESYSGKLYRDNVTDFSDSVMNGFNSVEVSKGSTKERTTSSAPIKIMDGDIALNSYIKEMEHFKAFAQPLRLMQKIFSDRTVVENIKEYSGDDIMPLINRHMKTIANDGRVEGNLARFLESFNNVFIATALGINPNITIKQLTSSLAYTAEIPFTDYVKNLPKSVIMGRSTWKEIMSNSSYLQDRAQAGVQDVLASYDRNPNAGFTLKVYKEGADKFAAALLKNVKWGDMGAIVGGMPVYLDAKNQFKQKNPDATEQQAIDHAIRVFEQITDKTQQSSSYLSKDIYQTGGTLPRLLTMFKTTPLQYHRKVMNSARQLYRSLPMTEGQAKGTVAQNLWQFTMYHSILPSLFQYVSIGLPGLLREWEKEDVKDIGLAALFGNVGALFLLGSVATGYKDWLGDKPWATLKEGSVLKSIDNVEKVMQLQGRINALSAKVQAKPENQANIEKLDKLRKEFWTEVGNLRLPVKSTQNLINNISDLINSNYDTAGEAIMKIIGTSPYQQKKVIKPILQQKYQYYMDKPILTAGDIEDLEEVRAMAKEIGLKLE